MVGRSRAGAVDRLPAAPAEDGQVDSDPVDHDRGLLVLPAGLEGTALVAQLGIGAPEQLQRLVKLGHTADHRQHDAQVAVHRLRVCVRDDDRRSRVLDSIHRRPVPGLDR